MKVIIRYFALYLLIFRDSAKMRTSTHKDAFPASFDEQILEWKDPVLLFYFLKTSNLSFLAAKNSKKSILKKGLVARFLAGPYIYLRQRRIAHRFPAVESVKHKTHLILGHRSYFQSDVVRRRYNLARYIYIYYIYYIERAIPELYPLKYQLQEHGVNRTPRRQFESMQ